MEDLRASWGTYLRELREERGWTLNQLEMLTEKVGHRISRSRLSELERGEAPTVAEDIRAFALVYGVPATTILNELFVLRSDGFLSEDISPAHLIETGKQFFAKGRVLEAGWAFDLASKQLKPSDPIGSAEAKIWSAYCFQFPGGQKAAQSRIEEAIDNLIPGSPSWVRACALSMAIYASLGARGRTILVMNALSKEFETQEDPLLRAYLLGSRGWSYFLLNEYEKSTEDSVLSLEMYLDLEIPERAAKKAAVAGLSQKRLGNLDAAIKYGEIAEFQSQKSSNLPAIVYSLTSFAEILLPSHVLEAQKILEKIVPLIRESYFPEESEACFRMLEQIAEKQGNRADWRRWRKIRQQIPSYPLSLESPKFFKFDFALGFKGSKGAPKNQ